jgi:hypothetical protein
MILLINQKYSLDVLFVNLNSRPTRTLFRSNVHNVAVKKIIEFECQYITIMSNMTSRIKNVFQQNFRKNPFNDTYGQISLDFISGIVIFIVTFLFLFQTLTSLFVPFQSSSDEVKSTSNRVAITLAESTSGLANSPTDNNIISLKRAEELNYRMSTDTLYDDLRKDLGLGSETILYNLNVSLYDLDKSLYRDSSNNIVLNNGPVLPQDVNVAQTVRVVYVEQDDKFALLYVRVW